MTTKLSLVCDKPDIILKNTVHVKTPQQNNCINRGLFGVITHLHLIQGIHCDNTTFSQQDITKTRQGIYHIMASRKLLPNRMKYLSRNVASHFFPLLNKQFPMETTETALDNHVKFLISEDNI
jgi:hypothetical protein